MNSFTELYTGKRGPTFGYLLDCVLRARIDSHHESNVDFYDEDVNVYLAGLLDHYTQPDFLDRAREYVCQYDTDIAQKAEVHNDKVYQYYLYKYNADNYLVLLGIFNGIRTPRIPALLRIPQSNFAGRAQTYYAFAAQYNQRIHRKSTAVSAILQKLSHHFETYREILGFVRYKYFHLLRRLRKGEWFHLTKQVNAAADQQLYKVKVDQFLESYSQYKKHQRPQDRKKLIMLSKELHNYNPEFKFKLK